MATAELPVDAGASLVVEDVLEESVQEVHRSRGSGARLEQSESPPAPSMELWDSLLTNIQDNSHHGVASEHADAESPRAVAEVVYASEDGTTSESSEGSGSSSSS